MEEQNKQCIRCKEKNIMQVMLPIAELSETGKVIFPNETENMSVQIPVSLCFKCMQFAEQGFINVVKIPNSNKLELIQLCDKDGSYSLEFFEERYNQGEIKKDIEESLQKVKLTREQVKKQKLRSPLKICILVDEIMDSYTKFKKSCEEGKARHSSQA